MKPSDVIKIHNELSTIKVAIAHMQELQKVHTKSLERHHRRSTMLEEKLLPLAEDRLAKQKIWEWCGKIVTAGATIFGATYGLYELVSVIKSMIQ